MQRIDFLQNIGTQRNVRSSDVGIQLLNGRRTQDDRGHERPRHGKGKRHLRRIKSRLLCQVQIGIDRLDGARVLIALQAVEQRLAGTCRKGAIAVFARQISLGQCRISQKTDIFPAGNFRKAGFEGPVDQGIAFWIETTRGTSYISDAAT